MIAIEQQPTTDAPCVHAPSRRITCDAALAETVNVIRMFDEHGLATRGEIGFWFNVDKSRVSRWINPREADRPDVQTVIDAKLSGRMPKRFIDLLPSFEAQVAPAAIPAKYTDPDGDGVHGSVKDIPLIVCYSAQAEAACGAAMVYRASDGVWDESDREYVRALRVESAAWHAAKEFVLGRV